MLPLSDDIVKLTTHLRTAASTHATVLGQFLEGSVKNAHGAYDGLSAVTLTQLILFNRRRQGEMSKMKIKDFQAKTISLESSFISSLSPVEKELVKHFERAELVGKRGNTVPVLFPKAAVNNIKLLLASRGKMGVNEENNFVFARSSHGSLGHIRGSDCLRKYANECGASSSESLTSTRLRKHIATMSQVLNLRDNELDILAKFMGHDVRVHREFYRLPDASLQLAKVSKLLIAMEKGGKGLKAGQTLEDISVNLNEGLFFFTFLSPLYLS